MRRALLIAGIALLAVIVGISWVYAGIQGEHADEKDRAVQRALAETELARAERVDYFAGDDVYYIVHGTNEQNISMVVWVGPDEIHAEESERGARREQIRSRVEAEHGKVEWIRLVPGKYEDEYVWEAYFMKQEPDGKRPYYEYYRFRDGERLDTLRLNIE